ncbi:MAG: DUF5674 family protein [Patescibacteria group bacterium]
MLILNKKTKLKQLLSEIKINKSCIKSVIDIENRIVVMDLDLHIDGEDFLMDLGSSNENIWGFYYFPEEDKIEYYAMINFKPLQNNNSEDILNKEIIDKIKMCLTDYIIDM